MKLLPVLLSSVTASLVCFLSAGAFFLCIEPVFAGDAFTQAVVLYGDKKYGESEKLLLQHLSTNPKSADAHYYLAACLHRQGKVPEAIKEYQLIINSFPGTQAAAYSAQGLASLASAARAPANDKDNTAKTASDNPFEASPHSDKDVIPDQDWVPYSKYVSGNLKIKASINGRPLEMMFDTGASTTVIPLKNWQAMGFPRPSGAPTGRSSGVGGGVAQWTEEVEVTVSKITKHMYVNIAEGMATDPLLGETFFGDFQYNIDNRAGYIHFFKKGHNSSASAIPYNSIDIPFRKVGNEMIVTGKVNGRDQDFFFDTGASLCLFTTTQLSNLGISIPSTAMLGYVTGVGGRSMVFHFPIDRIEVGDLRKTNFMITVSRDNVPFPLLGQTFFGDRKYVIDNDRQLIRFVR